MKFKEAKEIVIKWFEEHNKTVITIKFGWKWRWYPRFRKQLKQWAIEIEKEEYKKIKEEFWGDKNK